MDREETVRIARAINSGIIETRDISKLLMEYCVVEHNKPTDATQRLIEILQLTPLISDHLKIALDYFSKKFGVFKLWNTQGKVLLIY